MKEELKDLCDEPFRSHLSTVLHYFPGGHRADQKTAMNPQSKASHQPPALQLAEHCEQAQEGDFSSLLTTGDKPGVLGAVLDTRNAWT